MEVNGMNFKILNSWAGEISQTECCLVGQALGPEFKSQMETKMSGEAIESM